MTLRNKSTGKSLLLVSLRLLPLHLQISGLSALTKLETLDLSDNFISCVAGLDCLPLLSTLNLSGNKVILRAWCRCAVAALVFNPARCLHVWACQARTWHVQFVKHA